jgi:hypothetical protein
MKMYYCETTNRKIVRYRSRFFNRMVGGHGRLTEQIKLVIMALCIPETSGPGQFPAGFTQTRWWGGIKTLFWMLNAIVIGIIISNVCK